MFSQETNLKNILAQNIEITILVLVLKYEKCSVDIEQYLLNANISVSKSALEMS